MRNTPVRWYLVAGIGLAAASCATTPGTQPAITFRLPLVTVTAPSGVTHEIEDGATFEDQDVHLTAGGAEGVVALVLENRSGSTLRILWDHSAYIDENGFSGRVVSGETRVIDVARSQPTRSVPAGTRAAFYAVPASDTKGPVFGTCEEARDRTVALLLAIEARGQTVEYLLEFETRDIAVTVSDGWGLKRYECEA